MPFCAESKTDINISFWGRNQLDSWFVVLQI